jgi:hypothetical protein
LGEANFHFLKGMFSDEDLRRPTRDSSTARTLGLFLIAALTTVVTATAQTSYSVIDLGVEVSPTDVNDNGEVVGSVGSGVSMTGFYFDDAGGLTPLPLTRQALAISDQGDIVGSASAGGAFLITGGRYVDLGAEHTAAGINEAPDQRAKRTRIAQRRCRLMQRFMTC